MKPPDMEKRFVLFMLLFFCILVLQYLFVTSKKPPAPQRITISQEELTSPTLSQLAAQPPGQAAVEAQPSPTPYVPEETAEVPALPPQEFTTSDYRMSLGAQGARIVSWEIVDPRFTLKDNDEKSAPVELINREFSSPLREYPLELEIRLYGGQLLDFFNQCTYEVRVEETAQGQLIELVSPLSPEGLQVRKRLEIPDEGFLSRLEIQLLNQSPYEYRLAAEGRGLGIVCAVGIGDRNLRDFEGRFGGQHGVFLTREERFRKVRPKLGKDVDFSGKVSWAGIQSKFFLLALVPEEAPAHAVSASVKQRNMPPEGLSKETEAPITVTLYSSPFELGPEKSMNFSYLIYAGPKHYELLTEAGHSLRRALFSGSYGFLRPLCLLLLKILQWLYEFSGNYGVAILLLTLIIRIVTYPLTHKAVKGQAEFAAQQQRLRPFIEEINKKYKNEPARKQKELMNLYRKHKINPVGAMMRGCLPTLLQFPIFLAFYFLLMQAIELKGASFLWIDDLSQPDALLSFQTPLPLLGYHFNLLPILMGATQLLMGMFTSTGLEEKSQKTFQYFFAIFFIFILYSFPSGLFLYWVASNVTYIAQQVYTRRLTARHLQEQQEA